MSVKLCIRTFKVNVGNVESRIESMWWTCELAKNVWLLNHRILVKIKEIPFQMKSELYLLGFMEEGTK